jgi:hypothetical protein
MEEKVPAKMLQYFESYYDVTEYIKSKIYHI